MTQDNYKATTEARIAHEAKQWRACDREAIAHKQNQQVQRAEYKARQQLRKTIDEAGER